MPPEKSIARSLGEFFGHIWKGVQEPVGQPPAKTEGKMVVHERTEEEVRDTPQGKVVLRRTIVEEMEVVPEPEKPRP
jgi:hypothetical protein